MKLLRNPEMIFVTLLLACGAVVFTVTAFLCGGSLGWLMVSAWVFFLLCFYIFTWRRYAAIAKLSSSIDRILHGEELSIADSREGELSVLHSELQKMLNRLGEQAEALKKDKVGLSNGLADISHQLRTPLTSMNLTVSMLRNPDLAPERRLTLLRELSQSLSRMDWLVETLLKLSKIDAGTAVFRKEKVWARELLEKAGETLLIPMELKEQQLILAEAYKQVQQLKGEGDAEAIRIYGEAFQKDPDFYEFIRTLETYEKTIDGNTTLILPSTAEILKYLSGSGN